MREVLPLDHVFRPSVVGLAVAAHLVWRAAGDVEHRRVRGQWAEAVLGTVLVDQSEQLLLCGIRIECCRMSGDGAGRQLQAQQAGQQHRNAALNGTAPDVPPHVPIRLLPATRRVSSNGGNSWLRIR